MPVKFHKVVETLKHLKYEDKLYLMDLFKKIIIAEKRKLLKMHAEESQKEYASGNIAFGSIKKLKKEL